MHLDRLEDRLTPASALDDVYLDLPLLMNHVTVQENQPNTPSLKANDTEAQDWQVQIVSPPTLGNLQLNPNGYFTYWPTIGNGNGSDSFTYRLWRFNMSTNQSEYSNTATVSFNYIGQTGGENHPPVANTDSAICSGSPIFIDVLTNDTDIDLDPLYITGYTNPSQGWVMQMGNSFTYYPNANITAASDSFNYTIHDGHGGTATGTVNITLNNNSNNSAPLVFPVDQSNFEGDVVGYAITAYDPDGDNITAFSITGLPSGLSYDPSMGYIFGSLMMGSAGTYEVTATAQDEHGAWSQPELFTWVVHSPLVNHAPIAWNEEWAGHHGQTLSNINWPVYDEDGDTLFISIDQYPTKGMLFPNMDGTWSYVANPDALGTDTILYHANDGYTNSSVAEITIHLNNELPQANPLGFSVHPGKTLEGIEISGSDVDFDPLTVIIDQYPSQGMLSQDPSTDLWTFTANTNAFGTDSIVFHLNDGAENSEAVTLYITFLNEAPEGVADAYFVDPNGTIAFPHSVLENDFDPDGDSLTTILETVPQYASLFYLNADGTFYYLPQAEVPTNFSGEDTFIYRISDGLLQSDSITVTIQWNSTNGAPIGVEDVYMVPENGVLTVTSLEGVLLNDDSRGNGPLTAQLAEGIDPTIGTLSFNGEGGFTFVAAPGFQNTTTFTYIPIGILDGPFGIATRVRLVAYNHAVSLVEQISLKSIKFFTQAGDVTTLNRQKAVQKDPSSTNVLVTPGPHYLDNNGNGNLMDSGDQLLGVQYQKNSSMFMGTEFIIPGNFSNLFPNIKIKAIATSIFGNIFLNLAPNLTWGANQAMDGIYRNNLLITNSYSSDVPLIDSVSISQYQFEFSFSLNNGQTWVSPNQAKTGPLQYISVFTTLTDPAIPANIPYFETVAYLACVNGGSNSNEVLAGIWNKFKFGNLTNSKFQSLTYYGDWKTNNTSSLSLLINKVGQCNSFVNLFKDVLKFQGINSLITRITASTAGEQLLINNWNFGNANTPQNLSNIYNYFNIVPDNVVTNFSNLISNDNSYRWIGNPAVTDLPGISGQNNPNPLSIFGQHFIVKIGNAYYDPSYGGESFSNAQQFEQRAISGFVSAVRANERDYNFDFNGVRGVENIIVSLLLFRRKNANEIGIVFQDQN